MVEMPEWARDIAVGGALLVHSDCLDPQLNCEAWRRCDWLAVAWLMLTGADERAHEASSGAILSYSYRLPREMHALFDKAWVNRIFLFLRRWAARENNASEEELFGSMPRASIVLTHDVDAIALTAEIRLKQGAFQAVNAVRAASRGLFAAAAARVASAARTGFGFDDFRTLRRVRDMERAAGLRSVLHFYGGRPGLMRRSIRRMLLDPAYDIASDYMRAELAAFREGGWTIGLHQSFDAWIGAPAMQAERARVASATGMEVIHCRQHWLHFSWASTWTAQEAAGLKTDSTLGFNDRPGFRTGHALRLHPWDFVKDAPMELEAVPMLFMDSHFYDYGTVPAEPVRPRMKYWLDEVRAVGGEITVNWHTHTITNTYGWGDGYEQLLDLLSESPLSPP